MLLNHRNRYMVRLVWDDLDSPAEPHRAHYGYIGLLHYEGSSDAPVHLVSIGGDEDRSAEVYILCDGRISREAEILSAALKKTLLDKGYVEDRDEDGDFQFSIQLLPYNEWSPLTTEGRQ